MRFKFWEKQVTLQPMNGLFDGEWDTSNYDPTMDKLAQYAWSEAFDLRNAADRAKVERIARLEAMFGQSFRIYKTTNVGGMRGGISVVQVGEFDHFPTSVEVAEVVSEDWGGGVYVVKPRLGGATHVLKGYTLDGPAKFPNPKKRQSIGENGTTVGDLQERALNKALENMPNEVMAQMGMALLSKQLGVRLPSAQSKGKTLEDRLLEEAIDEDPGLKREMQQKLVEAALAKHGGMEEEIKKMQRLQKLMNATGGKEGSNEGGWKEVFRAAFESGQVGEVVKGILSATQANRQQGQAQAPQSVVVDARVREARPQVIPGGVEAQIVGAGQVKSLPPPTVPVPAPASAPISAPVSTPAPALSTRQISSISPPQSAPATAAAWIGLLAKANMKELTRAVKGDAREFIREAYRLAIEEDDDVAEAVVKLVRDNDPTNLHQQLVSVIVPKLTGEWKALGSGMFGEEAYQDAVTLVGLLASETGAEWLKVAHGMCWWMEKKMKEELEARAKSESGAVEKDVEKNKAVLAEKAGKQVGKVVAAPSPFGGLEEEQANGLL